MFKMRQSSEECKFTRHDERMRGTWKRKTDEIRADSELLHELFAIIRKTDNVETELAQVLSLICSNASLHEINQCLAQITNEASRGRREISPEIEELRLLTSAALDQTNVPATNPPSVCDTIETEKRKTVARGVLSVERLTDIPPYQVSAKAWTTVTEDDHLVSHLLSLWTTWDQFWTRGVIFELFLRDMRAQKRQCHFCSPLLVNVLLASGCGYSDYEEARTQSGHCSPLMYAFVDEAKSYMSDGLAATIPNMQALGVLYMVVSAGLDRDRESFVIAQQAFDMCSEMMKKRDSVISEAVNAEEAEELAYALDYAVWGTCSTFTAGLFGFRQVLNLPDWDHPCPDVSTLVNKFATRTWTPYPSRQDIQLVSHEDATLHHARLVPIESQLSSVLYGVDSSTTLDKETRFKSLCQLVDQLSAWYRDLPKPRLEPSMTQSPTILLLRFWGMYPMFVTMAELLNCLSEDNESKCLEEGQFSAEAIRRRMLNLALEVVEMIHAFWMVSMDPSKVHLIAAPSAYQALCVFLEQGKLSSSQHQYDSQATELCICLRAQARRWPWAMTLLRTAQIDLRRRGVDLPSQTAKLFEDFEKNEFRLYQASSAEDGMYSPFYMPAQAQKNVTEKAATPLSMKAFLEMFDEMKLAQENDNS